MFSQLRGTAACRGEAWADRVAIAISSPRTWPPHGGRAAALARKLVADLTRDRDLLELLAAELARWAAKRWAKTSASRSA